MSDHRRPPDPGLPLGMTAYESSVSGPLGRAPSVRTVLACLFGLGAACVLGLSVVTAFTAQLGITPDRPTRMVAVALSVPEVRAFLVDELVDDVDEDLVAEGRPPLTADETDELTEAVDTVLASRGFHRELEGLQVVDGRIDATAIVEAAARELDAEAAERSGEVRRLLEEVARDLPRVAEEEGVVSDAQETVDGLATLRRFAFGTAAVLLVPALVPLALALAFARRRGLTLAVVLSGSLLLASVVLAPGRWVLEHLPGPLALPGGLLAALGDVAGFGAVWTLVLLAALPPALWWAVGAVRARRAGATSSASTPQHGVPVP